MEGLLYACLVFLTLSGGAVMYRIITGPSDSDRAAASDMFLATVISLFITVGLLFDFKSTLDLLLVFSSAGFLASLALVRLILRDEQ